MKKIRRSVITGISAVVVSIVAVLVGCNMSNSANSTARNVGVDFSGFYSHGGAALSSKQTGATVTSMDLRQTGDQLQAVDNNGIIFNGALGNVVIDSSGSATASFELDGKTTANGAVTISGTMSGSQNQGTMSGTWIEPTLYGDFFAQGTISTIDTNNGGGTVTNSTGSVVISPTSTTLANNLQTVTFTASGGTGTFVTWVVADTTLGNLNTASGSTVVYTRIAPGNNNVTVTDSNGGTATATIAQP